jgi:hypothetical protein
MRWFLNAKRDSSKLDKAFSKFRNPPKGKSRHDFYDEITIDVGKQLMKISETDFLVKVLRERAKKGRS